MPTTPTPVKDHPRRAREVHSVDDEWTYRHESDDGTRWHTLHQPTNWWINASTGSLRQAREQTAWDDGRWILARMRDDVRYHLTLRITDRAREHAEATLAWLVEHHPDLMADQQPATAGT